MSFFPSSVVPLFLLLLTLTVNALTPPKPSTTLLLPVTKDTTTNQYVTRLLQKTPYSLFNLVVHLGARDSWMDCGYKSKTFSFVPCGSPDCSAALSGACQEPGNICSTTMDNPFINTSTVGELAQDSVALRTTDGFNPRRLVTVPNVTFSCAPKFLFHHLASGSQGMAGLGRTGVSLPSQLTSTVGYPNQFVLCLPSNGGSDGVIFIGKATTYHFLQNWNFTSTSFVYTPLVINPVSTALSYFSGEPSVEYFFNVKSIKVGGKVVPISSLLLSISKKGKGGTKLSTVDPYTKLQSSIYNAVLNAFQRASGLKRVTPVGPFGACFDGTNVGSTRVGPAVPPVELVLDGNGSWMWYGANTLVEAKSGVLCFGFVDAGVAPDTSIVVGGFQMENNLVLLDNVGKKLGVSGSLLFRQTTCSNFNFTAVP